MGSQFETAVGTWVTGRCKVGHVLFCQGTVKVASRAISAPKKYLQVQNKMQEMQEKLRNLAQSAST